MARARKPGAPGKTKIPKEIVTETRKRLKKAFAKTAAASLTELDIVAQQHYLYLETLEKPSPIIPGLMPARLGKLGQPRRTPLGRMVWHGDTEDWSLQLYKWSDECWDEGNNACTCGGTPEDCIIEAIQGW